jgi:hypothetical protein
MTWLELYNFLHKIANNVDNLNPNLWQQKVLVHNAETGDEYTCDTWELTDNKNKRIVIVFNHDEI